MLVFDFFVIIIVIINVILWVAITVLCVLSCVVPNTDDVEGNAIQSPVLTPSNYGTGTANVQNTLNASA